MASVLLLSGCARGETLIPNYTEDWAPEITEIYYASVEKAEKSGWTTEVVEGGVAAQQGKEVFDLSANDGSGIIYYNKNLGDPQPVPVEENIIYRIERIINDQYATVGKIVDKNVYIYSQMENGKNYTLNITVNEGLITQISSYTEGRLMLDSKVGYEVTPNELAALENYFAY